METDVLNTRVYISRSDLDYDSSSTLNTADVIYASIILSIEIPLICAAIYVVFFLIKSGQGAPVFVINLLITDLIMIACATPVFFFYRREYYFILPLYMTFLTGPYFTTCVAVERYLLIAHPVWYRSHRSAKCIVCTSLIGWLSAIIISLLGLLFDGSLLVIMPLIYYIVIIICFVGAYRALSHSQSVTSIKRQSVLDSLFFVLLSYTFTILPIIILELLYLIIGFSNSYVDHIPIINFTLNPIADCVLYLFMRNDVGNAFRTPHCCPGQRRIQREIPLANLNDVQHHPV